MKTVSGGKPPAGLELPAHPDRLFNRGSIAVTVTMNEKDTCPPGHSLEQRLGRCAVKRHAEPVESSDRDARPGVGSDLLLASTRVHDPRLDKQSGVGCIRNRARCRWLGKHRLANPLFLILASLPSMPARALPGIRPGWPVGGHSTESSVTAMILRRQEIDDGHGEESAARHQAVRELNGSLVLGK